VLVQIHVTPEEIQYFSRRGREHGDLTDYVVFDRVVRQQVGLCRGWLGFRGGADYHRVHFGRGG
jgi:hypothetical protein